MTIELVEIEPSEEELVMVVEALQKLVNKNSNYDAEVLVNCLRYEEILKLLKNEGVIDLTFQGQLGV